MNAWLIRIEPDLRNRSASQDLRDIVAIHQRVMTLVPDGLGRDPRQRAGVLFRIDQEPTGPVVLVQTTLQPDPSRLPPRYGHVDTRDIGPLLKAIHPGMRVRYRLAANPSKRAITGPHAGKVVPLSGPDVEAWWIKRAETHGLALEQMHTHPQPSMIGKAKPIRHAVTRFDGTAVVRDVDLVRAAVLGGIGRGKSFGCGLLSLAAAR
ncbi:type I-E CRISPR-associated protein Cas6/Cse3/CasE [Solwaraspora sp. WMMD1047]|uniref:type I-E CRISPR-associated protein Cas6/Cse3/CasE n=1 Tax=Solwaraspora sp. WMMD1047 TaxID=3016102 RepID=UPI002416C334|nr:type I-E CRISPR-associated protein Cas6/Cse3/CasE [Solwaraspora sp. WMMD1047]MDG4827691.1 type I-E CRISPR-associated protein Cas6/Cse3/CasE [Solwaraspora sp. WMMD1047]MDG4834882.1 type I-E CRISPR-associated protein Cas6/Cse3/CasE [Solwaraspora sp. WMMD1047]MDG4834887.1 type I-E CRISPR-associated protein Cas6/Cse3/CasE [Solwaraspora sp. WMMD1047]